MPHTNVLVVGNPDATRIVVDMLRLDLRGPVVKWRAGQPLDLPTPGLAATLVLENVSELNLEEQFRLLRWFDDMRGKIRVVSTTRVPLWPHVQVGVQRSPLLPFERRLRRPHDDVSPIRTVGAVALRCGGDHREPSFIFSRNGL